MREKIQSKKGFTLAELLIVVAIIAVLMAIMIPVFGNSRAAAILGRDAANLRSAFSEAVSTDMGDLKNYDDDGILYVDLKEYIKDLEVKFDGGTTATYDESAGTITVTHSKCDNEEVIPLDDDMKIGTVEINTTTGAKTGKPAAPTSNKLIDKGTVYS